MRLSFSDLANEMLCCDKKEFIIAVVMEVKATANDNTAHYITEELASGSSFTMMSSV